MLNELKKAIRNRNVILFVGAGISATVGLPTWSDLISHLASELGYDEAVFKQYGDSLMLAEYYVLEKGRIGELRSWMERKWIVSEEEIKKSPAYTAITNLNFPLIYTTNYDCCLETAMECRGLRYKKIVTVEDLVNLDSNITQIIKFHGDPISDDSIVLTESSYFKRLDFESPLDMKLRADMLGKSVLFIGYSLSDINIRLLIYKLDQLWKKSNLKKRPASYIFLPTPNPIQEEILESRGIHPIIGKGVNPKESTENFLKSLTIDTPW